MKNLILGLLLLILVPTQFGCSKNIEGKYFHDFGQERTVIELKPDKTVKTYTEYYDDGVLKKTAEDLTGTFQGDKDGLRTQWSEKVSDVFGGTQNLSQTVTIWWRVEDDTIINDVEGERFVRLTDAAVAAARQGTKLTPELTRAEAQKTLEKWIMPKVEDIRSKLEMPKASEEKEPLISPVQVDSIEEKAKDHMALAHIRFINLLVEYQTPLTPGEMRQQQQKALTETPYGTPGMPYGVQPYVSSFKTVYSIYSGTGTATFYHDGDGKWVLVYVHGDTQPGSPLEGETNWPVKIDVE